MDHQQAAANEPVELRLFPSRSESIRCGPGRAQGHSYFISAETKNYKLWHNMPYWQFHSSTALVREIGAA